MVIHTDIPRKNPEIKAMIKPQPVYERATKSGKLVGCFARTNTIPVLVDGIAYPSISVAARAIFALENSLAAAFRNGQTHFKGHTIEKMKKEGK